MPAPVRGLFVSDLFKLLTLLLCTVPIVLAGLVVYVLSHAARPPQPAPLTPVSTLF